MEQSKDILVFNNNLDQVSFLLNGEERKKLARRRWDLLAKALKSPSGSEPSSPTDEISVRRISSFMLLEIRELPSQILTNENIKRTWFEYSLKINKEVFKLNISHKNRTFSAEDLMGFNNTGNVCIWPSEETLSYYVCLNLEIFKGKSVMELGGGMSCLAGLFLAKYSLAENVIVTDGNKTSIDNVEAILEYNTFSCNTQCAILQWNEQKDFYKEFDIILSADCLFFDDYRIDFINCLRNYLSSKGFALIMAPQRGATLDSFIFQSESRGLVCNKILNYSDLISRKRQEFMDNSDYDDNIHYPILIEVRKV